jgi:hypothetical protein
MKNALPVSVCAGLVAAALSLTATVAAAQTAPASPPFPTTATPPPTLTGSAWGTAPAPQASGGVTAATTQGPAPTSATPPITLPPGSRLVPTGDGGFVVQGPAPVPPTRTPSSAPSPAPSRVAVATTDDEGSESVGLRRRPKKVWYGWQTLVVDGAGILVGVLGASNGSPEVTVLSSLNYSFGAPIVHAAHGEGIRALASIGVRTALPGAFGLLGYALSDNNSSQDSAIFGGVVLGAIAAIAIDAGALAYEEHCGCERDAKATKKSVAKSFTITPAVAPRAGGATLGVVGNF